MTANSTVSDRIRSKFEIIRDVIVVRVTCKNKEIRSKIKAIEWQQDIPNYNPMGAICCHGNQS